jgi:hypothetical protein
MIIFDLDGTLADCEHRRHLVDGSYRQGCDHWHQIPGHPCDMCDECKIKWKAWKPDWKAFYEACDLDIPIEATINLFSIIREDFTLEQFFLQNVQIWSGRCESVREKTVEWLNQHLLFDVHVAKRMTIKMRPMGDNTPDEELKERWLDEALANGRDIEFVFDDRKKVCRMWRRRGIFVFNCCQHDEEF